MMMTLSHDVNSRLLRFISLFSALGRGADHELVVDDRSEAVRTVSAAISTCETQKAHLELFRLKASIDEILSKEMVSIITNTTMIIRKTHRRNSFRPRLSLWLGEYVPTSYAMVPS